MKPIYYFISILVLLNVYLIYTISNFDYEFQTLKESNIRLANCEPLTSDQTLMRQFKEEYYLKQQDRDTKLIMFLIPIIFGIGSYFTYRKIIAEFAVNVNVLTNKYEDYESKWNEQHERLSKLELDLYFQIAGNYNDKAKIYENENNFKSYIVFSMCALEKYAQVIKVCNDGSYKQRILNLINSSIDYDYTLLKDTTAIFEITDLDFSVYKTRIATISNVLESEYLQKFNNIISKIKIT